MPDNKNAWPAACGSLPRSSDYPRLRRPAATRRGPGAADLRSGHRARPELSTAWARPGSLPTSAFARDASPRSAGSTRPRGEATYQRPPGALLRRGSSTCSVNELTLLVNPHVTFQDLSGNHDGDQRARANLSRLSMPQLQRKRRLNSAHYGIKQRLDRLHGIFHAAREAGASASTSERRRRETTVREMIVGCMPTAWRVRTRLTHAGNCCYGDASGALRSIERRNTLGALPAPGN